MNKVHYKMFKAGKKWMVAGIVTAAMSTGAFFVTSINANADVVSNASSYTGTPYSYGGTDNSGIDCSALVQNAYAADGVTLPRTSGAQYSATTPISAADAQPGDLVFFGNQGSDHVGIYSGNGNMINAETVDGVTSRQVSVMEKYLGAATYGRVNGGTQAASVNANVAPDNSAASDNTTTADNTNQNSAPVANTDETDTKILAPAPKADNQTSETTTTNGESSTAETPVQATSDQASTDKEAATLTDGSQTKTDTDTDAKQTAPVADATATNQTATTNATPDQALNNNTVANVTDGNNSTTNQNAVKNDNVVTLSTPAKPATDTTVAPTATSNKKAALPATGVKDNSFLSIIGLVLVSFVAMFGIKLRKNN